MPEAVPVKFFNVRESRLIGLMEERSGVLLSGEVRLRCHYNHPGCPCRCALSTNVLQTSSMPEAVLMNFFNVRESRIIGLMEGLVGNCCLAEIDARSVWLR